MTQTVEQAFFNILIFERRQGRKLKDFEVATPELNTSSAWKLAFMLLSNRNADVARQFHPESFEYSYWLFKNSIYRKKISK